MSLRSDSHLEVLPLAYEDPHTYSMSYVLERYDSGFVVGDLDMPEGRQREVFHFKCITSEVEIYPSSDTLRKTLDYYFAGGQLRVYRNYPGNLLIWTVDNPEGYSDVIQTNPAGATYSWYNPKMTRFSFEIDGTSII